MIKLHPADIRMETEKNGSLKGSKLCMLCHMFLFNADRENGNVNIFLSFR